MNALITSIISKKKIIFANEARLLKKAFLGFIILSISFQANELGDIFRQSMNLVINLF